MSNKNWAVSVLPKSSIESKLTKLLLSRQISGHREVAKWIESVLALYNFYGRTFLNLQKLKSKVCTLRYTNFESTIVSLTAKNCEKLVKISARENNRSYLAQQLRTRQFALVHLFVWCFHGTWWVVSSYPTNCILLRSASVFDFRFSSRGQLLLERKAKI